jgi:hypothetical protein
VLRVKNTFLRLDTPHHLAYCCPSIEFEGVKLLSIFLALLSISAFGSEGFHKIENAPNVIKKVAQSVVKIDEGWWN